MTIEQELFGAALKALRGKRTQREVARAAGMLSGTWSSYEAGKWLPRKAQRQRIFAALGCTPEDFELALWRVLSERLAPRHVADMVESLVDNPQLNKLVKLDLNKVPANCRSVFEELRHGLLIYSSQLSELGQGIKALFDVLGKPSETSSEEPAERADHGDS